MAITVPTQTFLTDEKRSCNRDYHQVTLLARISLTLSLSSHTSLSSITPGRSSRLHCVSIQSRFSSCWSANTNTSVWRGGHRRTSLMSLSLQYPACLVRLIWKVLEIGGRWPYSCCFLGCCFPGLFSIAHSILLQFHLAFSSVHFVNVLLYQGVVESANPFPGLLHFILGLYLIMLRVKQGGIKYHFLSLQVLLL